ncbi:MAG: ion channel [Thermonemataceae bacterium]|nr:ion channel [Thermonemataceae bacterium]
MAKHIKDPGFGQRYSQKTQKMIRRNGTYNVKRLGGSFSIKDFYSYLMGASALRFTFFFIVSFLLLNALFASLYFALGEGALKGTESYTWEDDFIHAFFFSVQTFTTVGYGGVAPHSIAANWIASANAFIGISWAALMAGLLFGRFSKPIPRIAFSEIVLIHEKAGSKYLQFRVVNQRSNAMMDTEADIVVSFLENNSEQYKKEYYALKLETSKIKFFPLNWTIVHLIDENSPFYDKTQEDLDKLDLEILVMLKGFDNTFHQTVYALHSYDSKDVVWDKFFVPMFSPDDDGKVVLDLRLLNETISLGS